MTFHSTMAGIFSNKSLNDNILMSGKNLSHGLKDLGFLPMVSAWTMICKSAYSRFYIFVGETRRVNHAFRFIGSYNVTIYGDMLTYSFGIQTHNVKWEMHGLFNVVVFFPQPDVITWLMVIQKKLQKPWKSLIFLLGNDRKK